MAQRLVELMKTALLLLMLAAPFCCHAQSEKGTSNSTFKRDILGYAETTGSRTILVQVSENTLQPPEVNRRLRHTLASIRQCSEVEGRGTFCIVVGDVRFAISHNPDIKLANTQRPRDYLQASLLGHMGRVWPEALRAFRDARPGWSKPWPKRPSWQFIVRNHRHTLSPA